MKIWDVSVIGGGIIGLSLSIALRKRGARVLVVERGEPGREASYAAAGMLVECSLETPALLQPLATASARMYPEFVHELQDESESMSTCATMARSCSLLRSTFMSVQDFRQSLCCQRRWPSLSQRSAM